MQSENVKTTAPEKSRQKHCASEQKSHRLCAFSRWKFFRFSLHFHFSLPINNHNVRRRVRERERERKKRGNEIKIKIGNFDGLWTLELNNPNKFTPKNFLAPHNLSHPVSLCGEKFEVFGPKLRKMSQANRSDAIEMKKPDIISMRKDVHEINAIGQLMRATKIVITVIKHKTTSLSLGIGIR